MRTPRIRIRILPDPLTFNDGSKVKTAAQWRTRRAEIVELFDREVYGRRPKNIPKVTWTVASTTEGKAGNVPVVTKQLVGRVDNSGLSGIERDDPGDAQHTEERDGTGAGGPDVRWRRRRCRQEFRDNDMHLPGAAAARAAGASGSRTRRRAARMRRRAWQLPALRLQLPAAAAPGGGNARALGAGTDRDARLGLRECRDRQHPGR